MLRLIAGANRCSGWKSVKVETRATSAIGQKQASERGGVGRRNLN